MNSKEIFKDVEGFEGLYLVSNYGNIMSLNYGNFGITKLLKPVNHHGGYKVVHLTKNRKVYNRMVHTLVAKAFISNPKNKPLVNHKDGNKHNNRADNLEWVTYKENKAHAIATGLVNPHINSNPKGKDNHNSKPIIQYSKSGELIKYWQCISDAARYLKCNPCMLVNNASGRTKSAHGYIWKYQDSN